MVGGHLPLAVVFGGHLWHFLNLAEREKRLVGLRQAAPQAKMCPRVGQNFLLIQKSKDPKTFLAGNIGQFCLVPFLFELLFDI